MLISEVMSNIFKSYFGETDDPDTSSEDYILVLQKVAEAIDRWENAKPGIIWKELFTNDSGTLVDGTSTYDLSSNFMYPAGYLLVYKNGVSSTPEIYKYASPEKVQLYEVNGNSAKYYYITGGDSNKVLNINPTPDSDLDGITWKLNYFKRATTYSDGTETTPLEMSDPWFVIHWALSQLYADDDNTTKFSIHNQIATDKLNMMVVRNEIVPFWQEDRQVDIHNDGFGV